MRKSLNAILVLCLSLIGANALASTVDFNVKKVSVETNDQGSNQNGNGDRGGRNMITREK